MKVLVKSFVIEQVIKNLLQTQKSAAENGDCMGSIQTAKLLIKLTKKHGDKIIDFSTIKRDENAEPPPDES